MARKKVQYKDQAEYQAKYRASEKGKAVYLKYLKDGRTTANQKRYFNTPKGRKALKEGQKRYFQSPKGKAAMARVRAKRRAHYDALIVCDLTFEQWQLILEAHNFQCKYCGVGGKLTQDHVIPISKGGPHTANNVVPACQRCNSLKGDKILIS